MIAALAWLAAFAGAVSAPRPVPYLWASAATPSGWELVQDHVWRVKGSTDGPAITVFFEEGVDASGWVSRQAEPTAFQRRAQRIESVRAGRVEHRGPWTLVETVAAGVDGSKTSSLFAALPAPAGAYTATYWGREPGYSRRKPQALAFLDAFRRMPPPLRYARLEVPGKFSVSVPTATWSTIVGDVDADARAIAPASPGGAPPGMLSALSLGAGKDAAARFMEQACGGSPARVVRTPAGSWTVAEALSKGKLSLPEKPWVEGGPRRSKCAALESGGRAYGLWWYAPPSAYDYGLPAFETALESFRPAR